MVRFIRRHATVLAVMLTVAGLAAPASSFAQADAPKAPADAPSSGGAPAPAAPAAPVAVPAAPVPTVTKETIDNPYGLEALWKQGDWVAKGTLIILLIMSMVLLVHHLHEAVGPVPPGQVRQGCEKRTPSGRPPSPREGAKRLPRTSAFRIHRRERAATPPSTMKVASTENISLRDWLTMALQRAVDGLNSKPSNGLSFLATVGSTAPFVGLFGTV